MAISSRSNDRGFVLLGAIWLLVLAGTVGAALLLRSLADARTAAAESRALADRMTLDGAAESAFASLLFHGQASPLTAGGGNTSVGGTPVALRLSSEALRLDLNEAPPEAIAAALQALGASPGERNRIVEAVAGARTEKRRLSSHAELRRLLGASAVWEDAFTLHSGLSQPPTGERGESLARRLASLNPRPEPVELRAGTPVRVDAALASGARLTAVARLTGLQEDPVAVQRWEYRRVGR